MAVYDGKLGVGLIAHARPHYFGPMVRSLEANDHLDNTDFHLFQDGRVNKFSGRVTAKQADLDAVQKEFDRVNLPNKEKHCRVENVSIGINQFEAFEYMTENYDLVAILEEDICVSPQYLRVMRILADMIKEDRSIFSASPSASRATPGLEVTDETLSQVGETEQHFFGIIFWSDRWREIRSKFMEYYRLVSGIDYRKRNHSKIRAVFDRNGHSHPATSQDSGKQMALKANGMRRIGLRINRSLYLGAVGEHFRPDIYEKFDCDNQRPYSFESDKTRTMFRMV